MFVTLQYVSRLSIPEPWPSCFSLQPSFAPGILGKVSGNAGLESKFPEQTNPILAIPIDIHIVHLTDSHFYLGFCSARWSYHQRESLVKVVWSLQPFGFPTLFGFAPVEFSAFSCPMFGSWLGWSLKRVQRISQCAKVQGVSTNFVYFQNDGLVWTMNTEHPGIRPLYTGACTGHTAVGLA